MAGSAADQTGTDHLAETAGLQTVPMPARARLR